MSVIATLLLCRVVVLLPISSFGASERLCFMCPRKHKMWVLKVAPHRGASNVYQWRYEPQRQRRTFVHVHLANIPISLCVREVWSESSFGAFWTAKDAKFPRVDNFIGRTCQKVLFLTLWLLCFRRGMRNNTVDSRYIEFQGTLWNTSRYPYFDISDMQNWGKN